jgi:hypothetical protein
MNHRVPSMRLTFGIFVLFLGCSGGGAESIRDTAAIPTDTTRIEPVARGNYLGTFTIRNVNYGAYLRVQDTISAFYDGLRWIRICKFWAERRSCFISYRADV